MSELKSMSNTAVDLRTNLSKRPNAAVRRRRDAARSAARAHNEMERACRRRDAVEPSAATACYAASLASLSLSLNHAVGCLGVLIGDLFIEDTDKCSARPEHDP